MGNRVSALDKALIETLGETRAKTFSEMEKGMILFGMEEYGESLEKAIIRVLYRRENKGKAKNKKPIPISAPYETQKIIYAGKKNALPSCYPEIVVTNPYATVRVYKNGKIIVGLKKACIAFGFSGQEEAIAEFHRNNPHMNYQFIFENWNTCRDSSSKKKKTCTKKELSA